MTVSPMHRHWRKLAIVFAGLLGTILIILSVASFVLSTGSGSQWALKQALESINRNPELTVTIDEIQGTLFQGMSFGKASISSQSGEFLIEGLTTSWNPYSLLSGQFQLSNLEIQKIDIALLSKDGEEEEEEEEQPQQEFTLIENPLPVAASLENFRINQLTIDTNGETYVFSDIHLAAEVNEQQLGFNQLEFTAQEVAVVGSLEIAFAEFLPHQASLDWRYNADIGADINGQPLELAGQLNLQGDLRTLQIEHLLIAPVPIQSIGTFVPGLYDIPLAFTLVHSSDNFILPLENASEFQWSNVTLDSSGDLSSVALRLDTSLLLEEFPEIQIVAQGTYIDSRLELDTYNLLLGGNSISGSVTADWSQLPSFSGNYSLAALSLEELVELPEAIDLSGLSSSGIFESTILASGVEGAVTVQQLSGQLGSYPIEGQGSIEIKGGTVTLNQLQLVTQNNQFLLDGIYSDNLDLRWEVNAPSIEELLVGFSGKLKGTGSLRGELSSVDIEGQINGESLSYEKVSIDRFNLDFSRAAGSVQSQLDISTLSYTDSSRKDELSSISFNLEGVQTNHQINASANSEYGNLSLSLAGGISDISAPSWQGRVLTGSADTILGDWRVESESALSVSTNSINLSNSCWAQQAMTACFALQQESDGAIHAEGQLENFPLQVFNIDSSNEDTVGFNSALDDMAILPTLPTGVTVDGVVGGEISLTWEPVANPAMAFNFASGNGRLIIASTEPFLEDAYPEESDIELPISQPQEYTLELLQGNGSLENGRWLVNTEMLFLRENIDDSQLDASGQLTGELAVSADQSLSGTIDTQLEDISWLEAFIPEFSDISGSISGQAKLSGNLDSPTLTGSLDIDDVTLFINRFGISVANLTAKLETSNSNAVQLKGSASSGTGAIEFEGELLNPLSEQRVLTAKMAGNDFQLINIPDVQLEFSPDLTLTADLEKIELLGSVHLPIFNLTLYQLPETASDVSRDVVITNYPSSRPDLARSIAAQETMLFDIPLSGAVDISLGDQVSLTGFGMSTKLTGNLNIQQSATGSNLTYGELSLVDGNYQMYGQSLAIKQGKFLFFGAYDNPGIDVRATREVEDITVGVLMNGTLKNINSKLFSTPALVDSDIISVLVTGKPFSQIGQQDGDALLGTIARLGLDRGQGLTDTIRNKMGLDVLAVDATGNINNSVLTIGKYITPELFVRYGVGLFDNQSKVTVDYALSDRIKLQAESGEYQSVDIIYSVEQ